MLKFALFLILITAIYSTIILLETFDLPIIAFVGDYQIETSLIIGCLALIILLCLGLIIIKLFTISTNLSSTISKFFYSTNNKRCLNMLTEALAGTIAEDYKLAYAKLAKSKSLNNHDYLTIQNILAVEIEEDLEKKIILLEKLLPLKETAFFANKRLAEIYYQRKIYNKALSYLLASYNINPHDKSILLRLIEVNSYLESWSELMLFSSKLNRLDPKFFANNNKTIATCYFTAAKQLSKIGQEDQAIQYLKSALEFDTCNPQILELYCILNVDKSKGYDLVNKMLKSAFITNPSFELAMLRIQFNKGSNTEIYKQFTSEINHEQNKILLLTIASYLGIPKAE